MDEKQFVELLEGLLQPDTERVKSATATLKKSYYTSPASLTALIQILTSSPQTELRQLAAVEARKLVSKHWPQVPAAQKPEIRNHLLQATLNEEGTLVRHSSARVIAAIARLDLEDGEWTELPGLLQQAATSQTVRHREVGVYVIFALMESMGDFFTENLNQLFTLFSRTIQDPESAEVRINTMLSLSRVAMLLDAEEDEEAVATFQGTLPSMVQVLKDSIASRDEGHVMQAFEVFQTLLSCDAALLQKHFGDLIHFMIDLASNTDINDDYRAQALSFLMQCVRYRKLKVQGLRVGEQLTIKSLKIVTELGDLSADDDDITPARSALGLLDILASSLPPSQVVVPLLKAVGPYVASSNPDERRAGILSLGMCVEGAPDFIATQLNEILPMVLHLLEDPEVRVRSAALNGVARLSDDLAEDVGKEHARLIPALIKNFDLAINSGQGSQSEQNLEIIRGSCNAIDSLIEGLDKDDAAAYVSELVPRFSTLFNCDDYKAKAAAIGAVGSIASAAGDSFMPYFEATMQALGPYVSIKDSQEDLELRGVVGDAMGKIATAVGAEPFEKYVGPLMQASEEALHLDHPRLRETSYILWSTMSKVYEEKFSPYLDGVVRGLQECLKQEEANFEIELGEAAKDLIGEEVTIGGQKVKVAAAGADDDEDFEDMDDEDDFDDISAVTAVAMEKEIAVEVVGDVITSTRRNYLPYIQQTVETVLELIDHSYEGVRKAAVGTLFRTYASLWGLAEGDGMEKWKPGLPLQVQPTEDLMKLGDLLMTKTLDLWQDEMDRGTVTDINRNLAATLKLCGPAILVTTKGMVVTQVSEQLIAILSKRHTCQQDFGEEAEEEDALEESSEYDWLVIDTALDAVAALAAALGPAFSELWKVFEKPVLKYASSQESIERTAAVGTIAECIGGMEAAVTQYTSSLVKVLVHRLADEDPEVKSNAAYAVGLLAEKSTDEKTVLQNLQNIFMKLEPMFDESGTARLRDNAAGAVSRMILRYPHTVPLADVLPRLVEVLPLREDYEENKPVFDMIVKLYQADEPTIKSLTPQLAPVLQKVLGPPEEQLEEETRAKLVELVGYLQKQ